MNSTQQHFKIHGMDCAEEVAIVKREIGPVVGGEEYLSFDILNGKMSVARGAEPVSAETVMRAVARTGMRAERWQDTPRAGDRGGLWERRGRILDSSAR